MVDEYLHDVWVDAVKIIESLQPAKPVLGHFEHKFQDYVTFEEERIMKNLEGIRYNVDALDTVSAVTGPGRLENVRLSNNVSFSRFPDMLSAYFPVTVSFTPTRPSTIPNCH